MHILFLLIYIFMFNFNFTLQIKSRDHTPQHYIHTHDIRNFSMNYPTGSLELALCGALDTPPVHLRVNT